MIYCLWKLRFLTSDEKEYNFFKDLLNDLVDRIAKDETFGLTKEEIIKALNPNNLCGRAQNQVTDFIEERVNPVLDKYNDLTNCRFTLIN